MSEPGDELTPLPEDPEAKPRLSRSPYIGLGVAALVVSTVFATVAALASTRDAAAPAPQSEGTVETSTPETYTTDPTTSTSASGSAQPKKPDKNKKDGSATGRVDNGEDGSTTDDGGMTSGGGTTTRPGQTTPKPPHTTKPSPKPPSAAIGGGCSEGSLDCSFDGSGSTDPDGSITRYDWSFGDGQTGTGKNVSHHYDPGTYTVKLTVTDSQGLKASTTTQVTVTTPPTTSGN
jgi:chitinase